MKVPTVKCPKCHTTFIIHLQNEDLVMLLARSLGLYIEKMKEIR